MDERVVYAGLPDREAAQERAEGRFWKTQALELSARLNTLQSHLEQAPRTAVARSLVTVPDIGDISDVVVIEVLVKPGDRVKPEQSLITVESDKASMEIPSSQGGVIRNLLVKLGDIVNQGTAIAELDIPVSGEHSGFTPRAPEMVSLPVGQFLMGSPPSEPGRSDDEGPQHEVEIAYSLAIGKYPVTFEEWDACVADGGTTYKPSDEGWGRGKRPVINVSWQQAQEYVAWLNRKLGLAPVDPTRYRLPSEAEWEFACRAGTTGMYSTPDGLMSEEWANFDASQTFEGAPTPGRHFAKTTPVGIYPANAWGLHDMHGNVWEWVQDGYEDSYRGAPTDGRAWETGSSRRVLRGGSWYFDPASLRSAARLKVLPECKDFGGSGFRLARTF